jgi:RHS repeat-associated protein
MHYIPTGSGTTAVNIKYNGEEDTTYFLVKDYLGSVMKVLRPDGSTVEEHSYDPWGNPRNPDDWSFENVNTTFLTGRGYTGHEHLPEFQLINMNGRMYDPIIGRVLSPDNYVQNPYSAQNYNRYSYVLNNPLKYTDPTGHKLKWWQWGLIGLGADLLTGGAISITAGLTGMFATTTAGLTSSFAATTIGQTGMLFASTYTTTLASLPIIQTSISATDFVVAYFDCIVRNDKLLKNWFKIEAGMFLHIPVWETIQAQMGNTVSHFRNMTFQVDNVEVNKGSVLVNRNNTNDENKWGMTLGPYINSKNINIGDNIYEHEYGHTIQSRILGPLYISRVGISSLASAAYAYNITDNHDYHKYSWFEVWANKLAGVPVSNKYPRSIRHNKWWYWTLILSSPFFPN